MLRDPPIDDNASDEIDLVTWGLRLWRRKWLGLLIVAAFVASAAVYLHRADYLYTAKLLVSPADQSGSRPGGDLASLGSLVGVNISGQASSAFSMYADAATSYPVAERLSRDRRIMHSVFRSQWDEQLRGWHQPTSAFGSLLSLIKGAIGVQQRPWHPPDARDLKLFMESEIGVVEDKRKSAATLVFSDTDPLFAGYFLTQINATADSFLREKALARATSYVTYLERRLGQIQVAEYRQSMAQVLGNYEKTRMMASSNASFAAEPFGGVWVSPVPTYPRPLVILMLSALAGLVVWLALVLVLLPTISTFRNRARLASR
ncbi:Wzz/FepE/Etk N-terminal domain-containing protein [Glacieibacterium sp.]|uniref:Wzz/FepE/Etk N-terminal domain-containing protein n=1 Tax=Glacieibacterium sp. TaxID=2860237 RepID=UPI003AFF7EF8